MGDFRKRLQTDSEGKNLAWKYLTQRKKILSPKVQGQNSYPNQSIHSPAPPPPPQKSHGRLAKFQYGRLNKGHKGCDTRSWSTELDFWRHDLVDLWLDIRFKTILEGLSFPLLVQRSLLTLELTWNFIFQLLYCAL